MTKTTDETGQTNDITWERYVFGKLVQHDGGAILPGAEHGCTGLSRDFPSGLKHLCHPSILGLRNLDFPRRAAPSPWAHTGGVVSTTCIIEDTPWIVAARARERSERGEGADGRLYAEAHYVAIRAENFRSGMLLSMAEHLQATPLAESTSDLPPLVLDDETCDLPDNWIDRFASPLRALMSGVSWSEQNWTISIREFMQTVSVCLAAIPSTMAWRVQIAVGVPQMDGGVGLACGMVALGGLRIIGGTPRNSEEFDFCPGDAYVKWLATVASACRTTRDLRQCLSIHVPELDAVDSIDVHLDWRDVAHLIYERMSEHRVLRAAINELTRGTLVSLPDLHALQRPFIDALLIQAANRWDSDILQFFDEASTRWPEAWSPWDATMSIPPSIRLFFSHSTEDLRDPRVLWQVANVDCPMAMETGFVNCVGSALAKPDASGDWIKLFERVDASANWVRRSVINNWARVTWLAIRSIPIITLESVVVKLRQLPPNDRIEEVIQLLITGRIPAAGRLDDFIEACNSEDNESLDYIVDIVLRASPYAALTLCHLAGVGARITKTVLRNPVHFGQRAAVTLANEMIQPHARFNMLITSILVAHWPCIEKEPCALKLGECIAIRVGAPYSVGIFGIHTSDKGPDAMFAERWCREQLVTRPFFLERLLAELPNLPAGAQGSATALVLAGLRSTTYAFPMNRPYTAAAIQLYKGGRVNSLSPLTTEHIRILEIAGSPEPSSGK